MSYKDLEFGFLRSNQDPKSYKITLMLFKNGIKKVQSILNLNFAVPNCGVPNHLFSGYRWSQTVIERLMWLEPQGVHSYSVLKWPELVLFYLAWSTYALNHINHYLLHLQPVVSWGVNGLYIVLFTALILSQIPQTKRMASRSGNKTGGQL